MRNISYLFIKIFLFTVLLVSVKISYSQWIEGHCVLIDQADHSGIQVISTYPRLGWVDTVYTDGSGFFKVRGAPLDSISILEFGKAGYDTQLLEVKQVHASPPTTTIPVQLLGDSKPIKYISDTIQGTLYEDTVYVATTHIDVAALTHLLIEPGTRIFFYKAAYFNWDGNVTCLGTAQKPIRMEGLFKDPLDVFNYWKGIYLGPNDIEYTHIYDGGIDMNSAGTRVNQAFVKNGTIIMGEKDCSIEYSEISGAVQGIDVRVRDDTNIIRNNKIHHCRDGIMLNNGDASAQVIARIENNNINYCKNGIIAGDDAFIIANRIHHNRIGVRSASNWIAYNDIDHNYIGIEVDGYSYDTIINNTIVYNGYGIQYFVWDKVVIHSNILAFNSLMGISFQGEDYNPGRFNLYFNETNFSYNTGPPGYTGVNSHGDSIDVFQNVYVDPDLYSTDTNNAHYLFLNTSSTCIDTGDSNFVDIDNSRSDIGAHPAFAPVAIAESGQVKKQDLMIFPNPTDGLFNIITDHSSEGIIQLFDLQGSLVYEHQIQENSSVIKISLPGHLNEGIYILRCFQPGNTVTGKILLKKN